MAKKSKPAAAKEPSVKAGAPKKSKPAAGKPGAKTSNNKSSNQGSKTAKSPPKRAPKPLATSIAEPLPLESAVAAEPLPLSARFESFDDAKRATIDALVDSIEAAEARLLEIKRSTTFEQLEPLANGEDPAHAVS